MSHLFDNYGLDKNGKYKSQKVIPDNTTPRLLIKPDYNEVIVLGADNTHCFAIPHRREEVSALKIVYNQGIETKLIKEYPVVYSENNEVENEVLDTQELGTTLGASNDQDIGDTNTYGDSSTQAILDELENYFGGPKSEEDPNIDPSPFIPSETIHWDFPGNSRYWKSLISFDITADETKNFNWYNQDVNVQIFITLRSGHFKSQLDFKFDDNESLDEILARINFKGINDPLEEDVDYEFIEEDDPIDMPDGGPARYDVSPIYKIKIVRKLEEGEISNE